MPDLRRAKCQRCGKSSADAGGISWGGLCTDCAKEAVGANIEGLMTMSGPAVTRWRRGMAAAVGAVLLDDAPARGHTHA